MYVLAFVSVVTICVLAYVCEHVFMLVCAVCMQACAVYEDIELLFVGLHVFIRLYGYQIYL